MFSSGHRHSKCRVKLLLRVTDRVSAELTCSYLVTDIVSVWITCSYLATDIVSVVKASLISCTASVCDVVCTWFILSI